MKLAIGSKSQFVTAMLLALESSCDESAVALLRCEDGAMLAQKITSQIDVHRPFGGVVPEIASRNHMVMLPLLVESIFTRGEWSMSEVRAFAATLGPGLTSSLLIGTMMAKGMAYASGLPFVGANHIEGHLVSPFVDEGKPGELPPHIALVVSGGHTLLVEVRDFGDYRLLGTTRDDAAGEAFDKVGKMLGLPYPGGPEVERLSELGDPGAFEFPRSMLHSGDLAFSFSGLKTAVRYKIAKLDPPLAVADTRIADFCAAFQAAVIDVLVGKTIAAARACGADMVAVSGGVSCNRALQVALAVSCAEKNLHLKFAPPALTGDNAAMIASAANHHFIRGEVTDLSANVFPRLGDEFFEQKA